MGSNGLVAKEETSQVEFTSLTTLFEQKCPIFMSYGMSYDEFWYGSPYRAKFYLESYKIKMRQKDEELWMQGVYIYEALCDVSPILHAFCQKGTKPLPYPNAPYSAQNKKLMNKKEKEQNKKNAEMTARIFFENWARNTKEHFEKNKK